MITDRALEVSTAQAVTVTASSTNSIDLGSVAAARSNMGLWPAVCMITVDVSAAGSGASMTLAVITATDAGLTTGVKIVSSLPAIIVVANLTAGRNPIIMRMNPDVAGDQGLWGRYLGVKYTIVSGPFTAGAFTARFLLDYQDSQIFPGEPTT